MTVETIESMENRWALLMAARNQKGERIHDIDVKYQRECMALRVQIEERKAAEAKRPQISKTQLEQLQWLDRLRGTRDAEGRPLLLDKGQKGTTFRENIYNVQRRLDRGEDISGDIAATERELTAQKLALPAPAVDQSAVIQQRAANHLGGYMPPATATQLGYGSINTNQGPK